MSFWDEVKKDLQKGINEGIHFIKEGAIVIKKKTGKLTEEGKKRYRILELKMKVHKLVSELGGKAYDLVSKSKNPLNDSRVKDLAAQIKKLEEQIVKLAGKAKIKPKAKTKKAKPKAKAKGASAKSR